MKVKMSDKYQVVIPREARKKMGIHRGTCMSVKRVTPTEITYAVVDVEDDPVKILHKYAGSLRGSWKEKGVTSVEWLRKDRDAWDEK